MAHNGYSNGPKDSKPDDDSDSNPPFSGYVNSANKNDDGSNTVCGKSNFADSDVPTAVTNNEKQNAMKLAAFIRKVLHNGKKLYDKMEWPLCLLIESKRSIKISQEELQTIILTKAAEVMATQDKSHIKNQMLNLSECKHQQCLYYKKYKELSKDVETVISKLELLNRVPNNEVKFVRNVGTYVNMPPKGKNTL
ncbi:uncharacterized protein LOC132935877 [Metopolophium dirhodum]|uniref:uncharacterized protein LOC132935877 n=1 Tax=Metopolophium dirhodum TaxID=44670 RepID=UPI0029900E45|nr:uncharacterized protein LOC132935877 [Metopolophium dirhodum]